MPNTNPPHGIFDLAVSRTLAVTEGLLLAAAVLIVLLGAIMAYFVWSRKRRLKPKGKVNPWEELEKSLAPSLDQSPQDRMGILNQTLRRALELRTHKPFTAWTSVEIIKELESDGQFSSDFQARCGEFLKAADRVIFAHGGWDLEQRDHDERQIALWLQRLQLGNPL